MDYHQKALNIQKSRVTGKAMTAETCVLMGMVKSKMGEFQSALDVRSCLVYLLIPYRAMRVIDLAPSMIFVCSCTRIHCSFSRVH